MGSLQFSLEWFKGQNYCKNYTRMPKFVSNGFIVVLEMFSDAKLC